MQTLSMHLRNLIMSFISNCVQTRLHFRGRGFLLSIETEYCYAESSVSSVQPRVLPMLCGGAPGCLQKIILDEMGFMVANGEFYVTRKTLKLIYLIKMYLKTLTVAL